jgi:hypothetical protein
MKRSEGKEEIKIFSISHECTLKVQKLDDDAKE